MLQGSYLDNRSGGKSPFEGGRGMTIVHLEETQLQRLYLSSRNSRLPSLDKEGQGWQYPVLLSILYHKLRSTQTCGIIVLDNYRITTDQKTKQASAKIS
ncbi:hypothetical protein OB13_14445 [Pontibacter sp. HJ8]